MPGPAAHADNGDRVASPDVSSVTSATIPWVEGKMASKFMKKYPELKECMGPNWRTLPWTIGVVALFLALGHVLARVQSWPVTLLMAWIVGGCFSNQGALMMHEAAHGLAHPNFFLNKLSGYTATLILFFPVLEPFRFYHLMHHAKAGFRYNKDKKSVPYDPDLATELEKSVFSGSFVTRAMFLFLMPWLYALRPFIAFSGLPEFNTQQTLSHIVNLAFNATVISYNAYVTAQYGGSPAHFVAWIVGTAFLGQGLHPWAMHFVAEHYAIGQNVPAEETYSCYDPIGNFFLFNGGYHVEHHDFMRANAWSLPRVHRILRKERYDRLPYYTNYFHLLYDFIFDKDTSLYRRVEYGLVQED